MQVKNKHLTILIEFIYIHGNIYPADAQSIADCRQTVGGKSGLRGTAYRLMTERGDPTIRATVTNRLKNIG